MEALDFGGDLGEKAAQERREKLGLERALWGKKSIREDSRLGR